MNLTEAVRLYVAREIGERRMTDSELADRANLTQTWVNRFLNQARGSRGLPIERAEALARGLGVSLTELLAAADEIRRGVN